MLLRKNLSYSVDPISLGQDANGNQIMRMKLSAHFNCKVSSQFYE